MASAPRRPCAQDRLHRFNQRVRVVAKLVEFENRIRIEYRIHDAADGELLTKGRTTQVAVALDTEEMSFESPAILIEKVQRLL